MTAALAKPAAPSIAVTADPAGSATDVEFNSRTDTADYHAAVEEALEAIRAGDIFQVQVGQRFEVTTDADPLDVYRMLRTSNPSPYMYLLRLAGTGAESTGAGAADARHRRLQPGIAGDASPAPGSPGCIPIAGTRPRGATDAKDAALAAELVSDEKERAEHVMLVDLGRNDLGRVCEPGTVRVVEFGAVERFSHVMHIVSTVVGTVQEGLDAVDVLAACYPAGTLSGAPKVRAMELIDELEPVRRGVYGGGVGYLDFGGDLDFAIAIRTAVMRGGRAYRAGSCRHRRRQHARFRGGRDPAQGPRRPAGTRHGRDPPPGGRAGRLRVVSEVPESSEATVESTAAPRRTLPRSAVLSILGVVVGAVVVLLSASPTWIRVSLRASTGHVTLRGSTSASAAVPLALVAVAGLIALALVRTWLRRVLAVLIALAGVGVAVAGVHVLSSAPAIARGNSRVSAAGRLSAAHVTAAPYVSLLGALLIVAGAVLAGMCSGGWPGPSRRYEAAETRQRRPADAWEALERGEDPTTG